MTVIRPVGYKAARAAKSTLRQSARGAIRHRNTYIRSVPVAKRWNDQEVAELRANMTPAQKRRYSNLRQTRDIGRQARNLGLATIGAGAAIAGARPTARAAQKIAARRAAPRPGIISRDLDKYRPRSATFREGAARVRDKLAGSDPRIMNFVAGNTAAAGGVQTAYGESVRHNAENKLKRMAVQKAVTGLDLARRDKAPVSADMSDRERASTIGLGALATTGGGHQVARGGKMYYQGKKVESLLNRGGVPLKNYKPDPSLVPSMREAARNMKSLGKSRAALGAVVGVPGAVLIGQGLRGSAHARREKALVRKNHENITEGRALPENFNWDIEEVEKRDYDPEVNRRRRMDQAQKASYVGGIGVIGGGGALTADRLARSKAFAHKAGKVTIDLPKLKPVAGPAAATLGGVGLLEASKRINRYKRNRGKSYRPLYGS